MVENGAFGNLTSLETLWLSENIQFNDLAPYAFTDKNNRTLHLKEVIRIHVSKQIFR